MISRKTLVFLLFAASLPPACTLTAQTAAPATAGYRDFTTEAKVEQELLAVPDAKLAGEDLMTLTA